MPRTKQAEPTAARCKQILDAASRLFAENGFHGTSMDTLARTAGMSVGHIYHYFESKEAIIAAIVQRDLARQLDFFERLQGQADFVQALVDGADEGLEIRLDRKQAALRLEILAEAGRNPKVAKTVRAADQTMRRTFREMVRRSVRELADLDDVDVEARIEAVLSAFDGLMIRGVRHRGLDKAAALRALRHAVRHLLTSPNEAPR